MEHTVWVEEHVPPAMQFKAVSQTDTDLAYFQKLDNMPSYSSKEKETQV